MEALIASYGDESDTDSDCSDRATTDYFYKTPSSVAGENVSLALPPPPLSLLNSSNSIATLDYLQSAEGSRVRNFPHVEGNYALHVYIPVCIPYASRKDMIQFLKKVVCLFPSLHAVDVDIPLNVLCKDDQKLEQVLMGREFHISLGRTVPLRVHQIDSMVSMLRQKLQYQKRYWIDYNNWEVFVNDDSTRTFLSIEVLNGGLTEINKQIQAVNEVYKLHNLPEFYKDPRPHISLGWATADVSSSLKRVVEEESKKLKSGGSSSSRVFTSRFSGIDCKIGNKTYRICKLSDDL